jgi:predicted aminopeptidase
VKWLLALWAALGLSGCANVSHWSQALGGHLSVLHAAKPVEAWLADPATPPALAERLRLAQQMRDFASSALGLLDNNSYRRYADLQRSAVVWNVVAAPEFGFALKTWCYPLMGCAGYRGYFDREAARAAAEPLRSEGWEVQVQAIPAYSTLGWSRWLGGDPLLNTFIDLPEGELAAMIFHELAHQQVYVADDTGFNEAYATAVERLGARAWLAQRPQAWAAFNTSRERREQFNALARSGRERLQAIYDADLPEADKRAAKRAALADWRAQASAALPAYQRWFDQANNASFAMLAAYNDLVPAFEQRFAACAQQWDCLHREVRRLASLPRDERRQALLARP